MNSNGTTPLKSASRSAPYQSPVETRRTVTFSEDTSSQRLTERHDSQDSIDFWGNMSNVEQSDDGRCTFFYYVSTKT